MTEADSVHSTPPLNSSSIPDGSPTREPRAESVDSFSPVAAVGQPEIGKRTSDSRKLAEDLSCEEVRQ
ncbi:hypothetical protein ABIB87_008721 [Bradyrhizobium sp. JR18.2]|jgi:hypothetical protein